MNKYLQQILESGKKDKLTILGIMSGTSLDGLDIGLCEISGSLEKPDIHLMQFKTVFYDRLIRNNLKSVAFKEDVKQKEITIMHSELGDYIADEINKALQEWKVDPTEIDLVASHGQTIYHIPNSYELNGDQRTATLQIGDGDHIAVATKLPVLSDFRQKDTAKGGQGAPLAVYLDKALFQDDEKNRCLINLGGIANLTYLPSSNSDEEVICTDLGPANTLINEAMQLLFQREYDVNGETARNGNVHPRLLSELHRHPFLRKEAPKTTGPEEFRLVWLQSLIKSIEVDDLYSEDIIATLTKFTADIVSNAVNDLPESEVIISGGGIHNSTLMETISMNLETSTITAIDDFGITADSKEAVLMAYLAYLWVRGEEPILGKLSLP